MTVKNVEKLEKSLVELTVEVSADEFEAAIEKAYKKQASKLKVPGFRPGKAPRKMIEKLYGVEVFYDEAINIAFPDAYMAALTESNINPVGYPETELVSVGAEGFTFKAKVAEFPEVKLGKYKGLSAVKPEIVVTAEDVKERLTALQERNCRVETVDRKAKKGDIAVIDFEGFDQGVPFEGGKGENHELELGSNSFVPGFEDQVIGMKAGDEKDIDITFPENYQADLAGKAVVFHVKCNAVKSKELPKLDDEFAKDVSEFDTLADLKKDLKKKATEERENQANRVFEDNLMDEVIKHVEADIPQVMIDEQAAKFIENFKSQIASSGMKFEDYAKATGMTEAALLDQAREPAERQVKLDLAMDAIEKAEKLEATEEEINAKFDEMAAQYGMKVEDLKKYISVDNLRYQIINDKAIRVIVDNAKALKPKAEKEEIKADEKEEAKTEKAAPKKTTKKAVKETSEPAEEKKTTKKTTTKKSTAKKAEE